MDISDTDIIPQIIQILKTAKKDDLKELNKEVSKLYQQVSNIRKMIESLPGKDMSILEQGGVIKRLERHISMQKRLLSEIKMKE
ncbi:hypothetical protein T552_02214 [Pneumocystis carinii B80]|uniref:Mediator of RNA polymerase II transcription subunit 9 n=1 Tax=Pneumocystis carinii (strain B80) TaxID=1408658 RepID=A0A0W4ZHC1_PNEC8|nr:hypothetical protein T552_02214 [Pneumocystis carinii B80]KTW27774.1 hypothetical protein T552_02214 [Pneumocystis carinii B80]